jgi:hypothetical protein
MPRDNDFNEPAPKKSNTLWYVLGGVGAGLVVFCCLPCGGCIGFSFYTNSQSEKRIASEPGITISADELVKNYSDAAYANKVLVVSGKVTNKSILGVEFGTSPKILATQSGSDAQTFDSVKIGDTVTVKGLCTGKPGDTIMMTNCHKK